MVQSTIVTFLLILAAVAGTAMADGPMRLVSIYLSIGTGENWRDDFPQIKPFLVTKQWGDWEGEYFIDRVTEELVSIMQKRIDQAAKWGADMVEFDNMDWVFDDNYRREYGFRVTTKEGITYYNRLCDYALSRGVKCMAKSTTEGAERFSGVTFESYHDAIEWWEPRQLREFLGKGKLGVVVHYNEKNPEKVFNLYRERYGDSLLFIAESRAKKRYVHFTSPDRQSFDSGIPTTHKGN